jgi:hypothetical protein
VKRFLTNCFENAILNMALISDVLAQERVSREKLKMGGSFASKRDETFCGLPHIREAIRNLFFLFFATS